MARRRSRKVQQRSKRSRVSRTQQRSKRSRTQQRSKRNRNRKLRKKNRSLKKKRKIKGGGSNVDIYVEDFLAEGKIKLPGILENLEIGEEVIVYPGTVNKLKMRVVNMFEIDDKTMLSLEDPAD
jgi:hypothetical protein